MDKLELDRDIPKRAIEYPLGWTIVYHQFYEVTPEHPVDIANCPGGEFWELFKSTLLVAEHREDDLMLDIGWMPEADPNGQYCLRLVKSCDYCAPIKEMLTRDTRLLIETSVAWANQY